jgi:hypothetical protein
VTREVVWTGHDRVFVEAMIAELGILLDAETATVSIVRTDHSVQMYTIDDGTIELSLIAGPNRIEVRRRFIGDRRDVVVDLTELRATQVRLHCHALVDRIQVREMEAQAVTDDQRSAPRLVRKGAFSSRHPLDRRWRW